MPRRPLERVPVLEQCMKCGRRAGRDHGLCIRCRRADDLRADLSRPFPKLPMTREEERQAREAESFGSSVIVPDWPPPICHHGWDSWVECPTCTSVADFDDGVPTRELDCQ